MRVAAVSRRTLTDSWAKKSLSEEEEEVARENVNANVETREGGLCRPREATRVEAGVTLAATSHRQVRLDRRQARLGAGRALLGRYRRHVELNSKRWRADGAAVG